jgi:phasin family protein
MTFPDPLSEASKQQLAKQIEFFQALTNRAFDNAERILALNIQATRATLDHTSGAVRQLAEARHPRDFAALGTQSQQQMEAVIAYGRRLMEITNKPVTPTPAPAPEPEQAAAPAPAASAPAPDEHIDTAPPVMVAEPVAPAPEPVLETAAEPVLETAAEPEPEPARASAVPAAEPVPADVAPPAAHVPPSAHPLGEADADPAPVPAIAAKPTRIAQAVGEIIAAPHGIPHPTAMPVPEPDAAPIAIPAVAPVDATPAQRHSTPAPLEGGGPAKRTRGAKKR